MPGSLRDSLYTIKYKVTYAHHYYSVCIYDVHVYMPKFMRVPPKTILHIWLHDAAWIIYNYHVCIMYIIILFKKYFLIIFKARPWKIICWQVCYKSCHTISLQWRMQPGWHQDLCQRLGSPAVRQGCCWRIECKLMELMSFGVCRPLFELFWSMELCCYKS